MTVMVPSDKLSRLEDQLVSEINVYDDLVDFLLEGQDTRRILAFRLPKTKQERLDSLLQLNRDGALSPEQRCELDTFVSLEHIVRLMKARAAQRAAS